MNNLLRVLKGDPLDSGNSYIEAVENQCTSCIHWDKEKPVVCTAFPKGIPLAILLGAFDHTHPYNIGGVSDHGILYEPKDE